MATLQELINQSKSTTPGAIPTRNTTNVGSNSGNTLPTKKSYTFEDLTGVSQSDFQAYQQSQLPQDGFWKSAIKTLARPLTQTGVQFADAFNKSKNVVGMLKEGPSGNWQQYAGNKNLPDSYNLGYFGDMKPLGRGSTGQTLKEGVGLGLEMASYIPITKGVGLGYQAVKGSLAGRLTKGFVLPLMKEGAAGMAMWTVGEGLQTNKKADEIVVDTITNSIIGAVAAPIFGAGMVGAVGGARALVKPLTSSGRAQIRAGLRVKGSNIMNRVAKLNPTDEVRFKQKSRSSFAPEGETIGEYLTRRGIYGTTEDIVIKLGERWQYTRNLVDQTFEMIDNIGNSPTRWNAAPIDNAINALVKREMQVSVPGSESPMYKRVMELANLNKTQGLNMKEINEVKRLFEQNIKVEYLKALNPRAVERATRMDTALREWQKKTASRYGFKELPALNRETLLAYNLANKLGDALVKRSGNNAITLTDWILLSGGDPRHIAGLAAKKFFSSEGVRSGIARKLAGAPTYKMPTPGLRTPIPYPLLPAGARRMGPPTLSSGVKAVPAKKMSYQNPKTGKYARGYTSEGQTTQGATQQAGTKGMKPSTNSGTGGAKGKVMPKRKTSGKPKNVLSERVSEARNVEQVLSSRVMPARTRVGTTGRYIGSPNIHTPQQLSGLVKKLKALNEKGKVGAQWYRKSADEIVRELGKEDAIKFLKLIAVYSNKSTPAQNYERALRAFIQYKAGKPIKGGGMGFMDRKAEAILRKGADWEGIKTNSFYQNMLKYIDPKNADVNAVTNDLWMMRAFGYSKKTSGMSEQQHVFMTRTIQKIAKETGQSPDEVQAAIWVAMRSGESKTVKSILEDAEGFAGVARRLYAGLSWEAAPSKSSGLFPEMFSAPWKQRMEFHARIESRFFDKNGRNIIFDMVGLPQGETLRAPGVWEGQVSPGTQFLVGVPRKVQTEAERKARLPSVIDPTAKEKLELASAIMGKLTHQDGVGFGTMYEPRKLSQVTAGVIDVGRVLNEKESIAFESALAKKFGNGNFAIIGVPNGAKVIHFTNFTPDQFRASIVEAVDGTFKGDAAVAVRWGVHDGGLITSKPQEYGKNYRELLESWRPGSRERVLLQSIEDGIESDIREFSRKYGWTDGRKAGNEWDYPIGGGKGVIPEKVNKQLDRYGFGYSKSSEVSKSYNEQQLTSSANFKNPVELSPDKTKAIVYGNEIPLNEIEQDLFKNKGVGFQKGYRLRYKWEYHSFGGRSLKTTKTRKQPFGFYSTGHPITDKPYINLAMNLGRKATKEEKTVLRSLQVAYHEIGHAIDDLYLRETRKLSWGTETVTTRLTMQYGDKIRPEIPTLAYERFVREMRATAELYGLKPEHVKMLYENKKVYLRDVNPEKWTGNEHLPGQGDLRRYHNDIEEVFAESYSMYRVHPEHLKKLSPKMYELIDNLVNKKRT